MPSLIVWTCIAAILLAVYLRILSNKANLPPGPRGIPLIGNIFQVPKMQTWTYFERLSRIYGAYCLGIPLPTAYSSILCEGPIVRLSLAGAEVIILNDPLDAEALVRHYPYPTYIAGHTVIK